MSKSKKETPKIEVENVRLSYDKKSSIVSKYVREKFDKETTAIRTLLSKEIGNIYEKMIPEVTKLTQEEQVKWFSHGSTFKLVGVDETIEEHGPIGVIYTNDTYPVPNKYDNYRGIEITPNEKIRKLVERLLDLRKQTRKFKDDFNSLLSAVNTSRQLCEIVPELAPLFPKRITGTAGNSSTQLVPIELVRNVRESLKKD